jgi:hypothetical protein
LLYGTCVKGYWKGAQVGLAISLVNDNPDACYKKTGVSNLESSLDTVTFVKDDDNKFTCLLDSHFTYYPPLSNAWSG